MLGKRNNTEFVVTMQNVDVGVCLEDLRCEGVGEGIWTMKRACSVKEACVESPSMLYTKPL